MGIPKPTAEEILESIRKIINGCEWRFVYDNQQPDQGVSTSDVIVSMDRKEWDNLKSLLREDGSGKVWRV